ncbi:RNA polymerase factor sigma-54 [Heyndrickxia ginsengihumi]|uniref:RNA polymerase factor sigma-54 n=1 Tax=Heyndrickxia ginsengihumi TaxID=363870 RepID=UPI001F1B4EDF|nr:RNA polymerase factor sigma-54 [Heyndrickxia ginsengihumi]
MADRTDSLEDHLFMQLDLKTLPQNMAKIIHLYIHHLDENGYLNISVETAAKQAKVSTEEAQEGLEILQMLDPAGIGARSLQECLLIQISRDAKAPAIASEVIEHHFLEFADKKWKHIAKAINVPIQDIQKVSDYIQTLNPRPAAPFINDLPQYITPDLMVKYHNGELELYLVEHAVPRIGLNEDYTSMMSASQDEQVSQFLKEKVQEYRWIQKSIQSRKETLLKIGNILLEKQHDFFLYGKGQLKPLTMKEVSEMIDMHESTVSRAVREKYIQTPFGTFPLKSFFSNALPIHTETGEDSASSTQIKTAISDLIAKEDKKKPLSDQAIVNLLNQEGYAISRRTVAKYREQLNIPSSAKRKRYDD